ETLDIHASYFVPDDLTLAAMQQALRRGVRIRVLVPGEHIDSEIVRVASRKLWGEVLKAGGEIHIFEPTMMHVKSLIADGFLVSVGSTIFDMRSFSLNVEASVNFYVRDLAVHMTDVCERGLERSRPYTYEEWRERPWRERFIETVV